MREETDYNESIEFFREDSYVEIKKWLQETMKLSITIKGLENTPYEREKYCCNLY